MADDVTNYLQNEFQRARRTFRVGVTVMGLLAVFLIGYFQWLKSQTEELLEPAAMSEFIVNETRRNLPHFTAALTSTIQESAPAVVRFVMQQVVDVVFPLLSDSFRTSFQEYSSALITVGRDTAMVAFQDSLRDLQAEVRKSNATSADAIATQASAFMTAQLPKRLEAASHEAIGSKAAESASMLVDVNRRLKDLSGKPKNREEELAKRLITTWWSFLQQNRHHVDVNLDVPVGPLTLPGGKLLDPNDVTKQPAPAKAAK
jgi:hypothetical protein